MRKRRTTKKNRGNHPRGESPSEKKSGDFSIPKVTEKRAARKSFQGNEAASFMEPGGRRGIRRGRSWRGRWYFSLFRGHGRSRDENSSLSALDQAIAKEMQKAGEGLKLWAGPPRWVALVGDRTKKTQQAAGGLLGENHAKFIMQGRF